MKNVLKNWKTSLGGLICILTAGTAIHNDAAKATDPEVLGLIATGIGLICAKDGDKTGTATTPKP